MGSEWGRWNAYLKPRLLVEEALAAKAFSSSILKPAFLSGPSRDEKRFGESLGAYLCHRLAKILKGIGLNNYAYYIQPLDAPEVALVISILIQALREDKGTEKTVSYSVDQIHTIKDQGFLGP